MPTRAKICRLSVAMSPPSATARSTSSLAAASRVPDGRRHDLRLPGRHHRRMPTLSLAEHERVIAAVVEAAAGRIKVMAGTGSNSTAEALQLTRWAARPGPTPPWSSPPTTTSPRRKASTSTSRPWPRRWTFRSASTTFPAGPAKHRAGNHRPDGRDAQHHHDQGGGRLDRSGLADPGPDRPVVLSGDDSLTLPLLAVGGRGVVSWWAISFPAT